MRETAAMTAAINDVVRQMLAREVEHMRAQGIAVGDDDYRGLYTSDGEAARLLEADHAEPDSGVAELARQLVEVGKQYPRGMRLAALPGLSDFDVGTMLFCFATEVDLGLERLVGYVQDDVTKRRPRVEMIERLFGCNEEAGAGARHFGPEAPLIRLGLVALGAEPGQPHTPLSAEYLWLTPRVAAYLQGDNQVAVELVDHATLLPREEVMQAALGGARLETVERLRDLPATQLRPPVVALSGPDARERELAAQAVAAGADLGILRVQFAPVVAERGVKDAYRLAAREAYLQGTALALDGLDGVSLEDRQSLLATIRAESVADLVFLLSNAPIAWPGISVALEALDIEWLLTRWEQFLEPHATTTDAEAIARLAGKFKLGSGQIGGAVDVAAGIARTRDPRQPTITIDDLYAGARTQSTPILNELAKKITPHYSWDDLVLPADPRAQLREMSLFVEHRHQVYDTWGMGGRLAMGKGLMSLFAGNSGTGKTMAADVLAGELGLDLYKIDLSGVVSKYIGETEKNLGTIFQEAETSNAILFFDEADALFGKRSEVKDAHDRYANIETAYLLQKMEEYSGVVILATNLKMNLDEAFLRRLHFVVDFPMPEEDDRLRIWRTTIPSELPLADDVDLAFLARQLKIAGGNIRNIVLAAAFFAADEQTPVTMAHLVRATRREYQKLGRMVTEAEFGDYITVLRD